MSRTDAIFDCRSSRPSRAKAAEYAALIGDFGNAVGLIDGIIREMSIGSEQQTIQLFSTLAAAIHLAPGVSI